MDRLEKALRSGGPLRRGRALARLRSFLGIPADERGTPDLLSRLLPRELNNLQWSPLTAAVLLRTRTDGPDYLLWRLAEDSPKEWASRVLADAIPAFPFRRLRWIRGCFIHGNLPIRSCAPTLLGFLSDPRLPVRRTAAILLREACLKPVPPAADLHRLAADPVPAVRDLALGWMAQAIEEFAGVVVPALVGGPDRRRSPLRWRLMKTVELLAGAVPALATPRGRRFLRPGAMLLALRESSYAVIPALLHAVGSPDPRISGDAAEALHANWRGLHGQEDVLKRLERSRRPHVRRHLAALARLLPPLDS